ncbi:hypothetical protein BDV25DRAFT_115373 [Aspergillus avenaceus]|uniref:Uncharacterized protein n=1 Tax=Aspergillus avenaceus TaxID=36643 RepID=A0A5N6TUZ3_ASPAV|nr:hypothetical protein BDV25DRAFT_115373 [Aspergillus avenaceus]
MIHACYTRFNSGWVFIIFKEFRRLPLNRFLGMALLILFPAACWRCSSLRVRICALHILQTPFVHNLDFPCPLRRSLHIILSIVHVVFGGLYSIIEGAGSDYNRIGKKGQRFDLLPSQFMRD